MKTFLIFLLATSVQAFTPLLGQNINLNLKKTNLEKALFEISVQAQLDLVYDSKSLSRAHPVNIHLKNATVEQALNRVLSNQPFEYEIRKNTLIIKPRTKVIAISEDSLLPEVLAKIITGKVTDEDGKPLQGATVSVKGGASGTATDNSGNYSITIDDRAKTLIFSMVGYETREVNLTERDVVNVSLRLKNDEMSEVVVVGYGTQLKSDLTGSIAHIDADKFKYQSNTQLSDMLAGTVAGLNVSQGTGASGGSSIEVRGPTSLSAGTNPLIVVDGAIFFGSISDVNPYDIESIDVLKDASSAAVYGAKAASGVINITTKKGRKGTPVVNLSVKTGVSENYNQRRGLGPEAYLHFREDFLKQMNPNTNSYFYSNPNELPAGMSIDEWRNLSNNPLDDNIREWMARIRLFPIEQQNYLDGKTMDMYDEVFRKGLRQDYDASVSGGADRLHYYWSLGYVENNGIIVGDGYSKVRSRLNMDFSVTDWLKMGLNSQFSTFWNNTVPANMDFYVNSPYGQMFDEDGNLERYPHGHSNNPLLDYYRVSLSHRANTLFSNLFAEINLPLGINYKISFQPYYRFSSEYRFTTISEKLGGVSGEEPKGSRSESQNFNWMVDHILSWNKKVGVHNIDVTLLFNAEKNREWNSSMSNKGFVPNQNLGYNGLQFGNSPVITNNDNQSTGDALMGRLNYSLLNKYLLTASIRRDGFSAFGLRNPYATFPALALGWVISEERFFKINFVDRLKLRASWGMNGNRDIGIYSALSSLNSNAWFDGSQVQMGVFTSTMANKNLKWESTGNINLGLDATLLDEKVNITFDVYDMTTTNLLMGRRLPNVTGFNSITTNLGELQNKGLELTINTENIRRSDFRWQSNFIFSFNRNNIKSLYGDTGTYVLLGKQFTGEVPDFTNNWFPGHSIDAVWDYDVIGIWQLHEKDVAAKYGMEPGDFKAIDVNGDSSYVNVDDKRFIGYSKPRYRLGLRNDFSFLKNFSMSVFIRADLGFIRDYWPAMNYGFESDDRWNRNNGPVPYWTKDKPNNEYARLNVNTGGYGGGVMIYKPSSFVRIQDVTLSYNVPLDVIQKAKIKSLQAFFSTRNLATFTNWPGWDPESGMSPMPRTFTIGLNCNL